MLHQDMTYTHTFYHAASGAATDVRDAVSPSKDRDQRGDRRDQR
jgi:hypothetical protein